VFHRLGPKVSHIISTHIIHYSKLVTQSNLNARVLGSIAFHILKKEEFEKKFVSA
jgi:predicted transcriptional regulator